MKVIFDRIESLEPWGYIMSDDLPKSYTWDNGANPNCEIIAEQTNIKTPIITNPNLDSDEIDLN